MTDITSIEDLKLDEKNANKGTERGRDILEDSLRRFGAGRSIVVDKDGEVIAGNKTLEVAAEMGLAVKVVNTDGSELVVVQRDDLDLDGDDGKARQLAYADNRSSEVGLAWDLERILTDVEEGVELSGLWTQQEIDALREEVTKKDGAPPELEISAELYERHDYLVIYFENEFDWQVACQLFDIKQVKSGPVGQRTIEHRGLGRVISAKDLFRVLGHGEQ